MQYHTKVQYQRHRAEICGPCRDYPWSWQMYRAVADGWSEWFRYGDELV